MKRLVILDLDVSIAINQLGFRLVNSMWLMILKFILSNPVLILSAATLDPKIIALRRR